MDNTFSVGTRLITPNNTTNSSIGTLLETLSCPQFIKPRSWPRTRETVTRGHIRQWGEFCRDWYTPLLFHTPSSSTPAIASLRSHSGNRESFREIGTIPPWKRWPPLAGDVAHPHESQGFRLSGLIDHALGPFRSNGTENNDLRSHFQLIFQLIVPEASRLSRRTIKFLCRTLKAETRIIPCHLACSKKA
jgi:hypothetical protein